MSGPGAGGPRGRDHAEEETRLPTRITAVIIARNAERTIAACVRSLSFCGRIVVGVNASGDRTAELASAAGAEVRNVSWEGYAQTKNALIAGVSEGWILSVDADEVVSPELSASIQRAASGRGPAGYWLGRRNYFLGREIRHAGWRPDWQLRLFRAGLGKFSARLVHEGLEVQGPTARLPGPLDHYTYFTLDDYLLRLETYTTLAARDRVLRGKKFSFLRLGFDSLWTFVKMYFCKGGWLDGVEGFLLCALSAVNTLVKHAKHWEYLRTSQAGGAPDHGQPES